MACSGSGQEANFQLKEQKIKVRRKGWHASDSSAPLPQGRSISVTAKSAHAARCSEKETGLTVLVQVTRSCHRRVATAPRFSLGRICCTTAQPPAPAPSPSATAGICGAHGWTGPEKWVQERSKQPCHCVKCYKGRVAQAKMLLYTSSGSCFWSQLP